MTPVKTMSSSANRVAVVEIYQWSVLALQLQCLSVIVRLTLTVAELQNLQNKLKVKRLKPRASMDAFTAAARADFISSQTGKHYRDTLNRICKVHQRDR
jgi:hypothetical protein